MCPAVMSYCQADGTCGMNSQPACAISILCRGNSTGARTGYAPDATDTYLPDCGNVLAHEYYRVFKKEDGTAYMVPRPDGLGVTYGLCGGADVPPIPALGSFDVQAKAKQYGLCDATVKDPSIINSMAPEDALALARIFHRALAFRSPGAVGGMAISPHPMQDDLEKACDYLTEAGVSTNAAESYCNQILAQPQSLLPITPPAAAAAVVVSGLNQHYKIPSVGDACDKDGWQNTFGCPMAKCVSMLPSGCEYVMNHNVINDRRDCCAAMCYAEDSAGNACGGTDIDGGTKAASSSNVHATALAASAWLLASLV